MGNTWYWPAKAWHIRAFSAVLSTGLLQSLILQKNFFVERIMPAGVKYPLAPEVMDHYREPLSTPERRAGVAEFPRQITRSALWLGAISDEVPETLGTLPALLTWGIRDYAFTPPFMDRFKRDFQSVRVVRLDARHFIQEDAPAEISKAIQDFLGAS
jgi:haloalkane dehalogenase